MRGCGWLRARPWKPSATRLDRLADCDPTCCNETRDATPDTLAGHARPLVDHSRRRGRNGLLHSGKDCSTLAPARLAKYGGPNRRLPAFHAVACALGNKKPAPGWSPQRRLGRNLDLLRRNFSRRTPSSPASSGRFPRTWDGHCDSRCSRRAPTHPRSAEACRPSSGAWRHCWC